MMVDTSHAVFKTVGSGKVSRASSMFVAVGMCGARRSAKAADTPQWRVVLHGAIRPKIDPFLDEQGGRIRNFEVKIAEIGTVGRNSV